MTTDIKKLSPEEFPRLLNEIPDKPKELYIRGVLPETNVKLLAVVGSRNYTEYGRDVCKKLISELSPYNIAIVSGLALGMDGIAHRAALDANLKTIAIPASGLDSSVLYPRTHVSLAENILEKGGALLSEYEPMKKAAIYTFPKRNRIMAGISHGVLIIEAAPKSGTLITARLAMEYNRDVLTVPGSIYSTNSEGPHELIKNGATPVTGIESILEVLGIERNETKTINLESLSKIERVIYKKLETPAARDYLLEEIDIPISEANSILSAMEIKGLIQEHLGKIHRL